MPAKKSTQPAKKVAAKAEKEVKEDLRTIHDTAREVAAAPASRNHNSP